MIIYCLTYFKCNLDELNYFILMIKLIYKLIYNCEVFFKNIFIFFSIIYQKVRTVININIVINIIIILMRNILLVHY